MCLFKSWGKTLQEPFLPTRPRPLPQATSKLDSCIMHACALSNRVRGKNHMSMRFLTAYVYCMSSSGIHSARDAPSKRSSTQPDLRTHTTDQASTNHRIAHNNTQRAPAQITRNVPPSIPTWEISNPDNPIGPVEHRDRPIAIYPL